MGLHSACCLIHNQARFSTHSPNQRLLPHRTVSPQYSGWRKKFHSLSFSRKEGPWSHNSSKSHWLPGLRRRIKEPSLTSVSREFSVCASSSNQDGKKLDSVEQKSAAVNGLEPFRGKAGSISFIGLTHQLVEEGKLVSSPFNESSGSLVWVLAPVALIISLVLPQFFIGYAIDGLLNDEVLTEVLASLSSEVIFYIGLATFMYVTDHVQKPYLQYSPKRWGLITGLKGYLASAFFTMGFKVCAPLLAVYVTWPVLGLPALVSVAPFLIGCLAQFSFEKFLQKRGSSCWPLVPIIFEVYRLYQLSKAAYFIEKFMFAMRGVPVSPEVLERSGALVAMIVTFQVLGVVCLWSLLTFLVRLFPSRPVAENY